MKSGNRDKLEGKAHQIKGTIKEAVGRTIENTEMEAEGKVENLDGKVQVMVGDIKKTVGK
jgi:uncharacterized protein YjbJ (UPF0337 family)